MLQGLTAEVLRRASDPLAFVAPTPGRCAPL